MKKLITRITASLGYLLGALGVMLATPGLILILVADSSSWPLLISMSRST